MHLEHLRAADELQDRIDQDLERARHAHAELGCRNRPQPASETRKAIPREHVLEPPAECCVACEAHSRGDEQVGDVRRPQRAARMVRDRLRRLRKVGQRLNRGEDVVPRTDQHGGGGCKQTRDAHGGASHQRQVSPQLRPLAFAPDEPVREQRREDQRCRRGHRPDGKCEQYCGTDQPACTMAR